MIITSLAFAVFCAASILVYWRLPQRHRILLLFAVSIVFIFTWSWDLAGVFLVVATVNFYVGRWLAIAERRQRVLLWIGIAFNILVLIGLKYTGFYIPALAALLERMGIQTVASSLSILVPLGLSFIVLQLISYLLDIYHRQFKPETRWLDFAVYVVYFPKILSGPIERARSFLPKIKQPMSLDAQSAERNFWLIIVGLIRKIILADTLSAMIPAEVFIHPENYPGQDLGVYLLAYAFIIYNDFAGYTSIVRGISGFFGIEMTSNFNLPYFSANISEFWGRWHISLSNWLREYIFFPISRTLKKRIQNGENIITLMVPPLVTMLVSGMWHGLGMNFLLWGMLHGFYLFIERITTIRSPKRLPGEFPKWRQALSTLGVFILVVLTWLPFRMGLASSWHYLVKLPTSVNWIRLLYWFLREKLKGTLAWNNWWGITFPDMRMFLLLFPALWLDWMQARHKDETFFFIWPVWAKALLLAVLALLLFLISLASTGALFIYQGF